MAVEQVKKKKNPAALPKVRFESFKEGPSAQIMYIGPFSAEGPTIPENPLRTSKTADTH